MEGILGCSFWDIVLEVMSGPGRDAFEESVVDYGYGPQRFPYRFEHKYSEKYTQSLIIDMKKRI